MSDESRRKRRYEKLKKLSEDGFALDVDAERAKLEKMTEKEFDDRCREICDHYSPEQINRFKQSLN